MRFDSYHPAINFIYFALVLATTISFNQPFFLCISYGASFFYSLKLNGKKSLFFNLLLIPGITLWALWYSYYNHFGVTRLAVNFIGNTITLEAVVYGFVTGIMVACILMWFSCVHAVISSDKVIYLFGKIAPKLSLFLSLLLRLVPRIRERAKKISTAQHCVGRGIRQGNFFRRLHNLFRVVSMVITWTMENLVDTSDSMRSRGYTLKGRTAFSIYRFDNRDRSFIIIIFWCAVVIWMGVLLDQTSILYDPEIILNRITPLSFVFYAAYAFLCLLPMSLQIVGECRFKKLRKKVNVCPAE